jgi:hypothetical protein
MTFIKNKFNHGNEILFVSLMVLLFAPPHYKLAGIGILWFLLVSAAIIDSSRKNSKRVRRITRRVASCSCEKARETISHMHMPQLLQINCTVCGAESM